jgi:hypothetical protein
VTWSFPLQPSFTFVCDATWWRREVGKKRRKRKKSRQEGSGIMNVADMTERQFFFGIF